MDEKPTEFSILFRQFIEILRRRGLERQVVLPLRASSNVEFGLQGIQETLTVNVR
jgi:hypothetical protein